MKTIKYLASTLCALVVLAMAGQASAYVFIHGQNCPSGATWPSNMQPLPYYINQNGSADVGMTELQSLIQDSFDEWGKPCCSSFSAGFQGTTSNTATNNGGDVVLSWEEGSWPTQYGSVRSTIAVTLISVDYNCNIRQAPILFNGVGFSFCTSGSRGCTDLQSIATHEIGHNLGLGHSQASRDATMYAAYQGGSGARSLHDDDIQGVCALYTTSCNCTSDADCASSQVCNTSNGTCEEAPCTSDSQCQAGQVCNTSTGDCERETCSSDADCSQAGFVCGSGGYCESECPVCQSCTSNGDCGSNGYCADVNQDGGNECIVTCGQDGTCPGDARCYQVQDNSGNAYHLCLNPDANTSGACPDSYVCTNTGGGSDGTCEGLGNDCANQGAACTPDNDVCLQSSDGSSICSCMCQSDADCGAGNTCVTVSNGQKACIPGSTSGGCTSDADCGSGQVCSSGQCVDDQPTDPCDGVSCPSGQYCSNGQCVDDGSTNPCDGVTCPGGQMCSNGNCVDDGTNPCDGVSCPSGQYCSNGQCVDDSVDACAGITCPGSQTCDNGRCVGGSTDAGGTNTDGGGTNTDGGGATFYDDTGNESSTCAVVAPGSTGAPAGLMLVLFGGLAAAWRRRRR